MKLSVCIETFWEGQPMEERVRRMAKAGIPAIEFWGWADKDLNKLGAAVKETGLQVASFAAPLEGGLAAHKDVATVVRSFQGAVGAARALGCKALIVTSGGARKGEPAADTSRRVVAALKELAKVAGDAGITVLLEPLNILVDHPGEWLTGTAQAAALVREAGAANCRILYDIYHQQITEGNVIQTIEKHLPLIGHFHSAGVPGRNELAGGELDYGAVFGKIEALGYRGFVGLEFTPLKGEEAALAEARRLARA